LASTHPRRTPRMSAARECPICLQDVRLDGRTACGHAFCKDCLTHWRANNDRCPICRSSLAAPSPPPARAASSKVLPVWQTAPRGPSSAVRAVDREHEERVSRRQRQLALERRLDAYNSRLFTPSGRPYDSLPVVSLAELRGILSSNTRGMYASGDSWS